MSIHLVEFIRNLYMFSCLVPNSYGLCYKEFKEADLLAIYTTLTPRLRQQSEQKYKTVKKTIAGLAQRLSLNPKTVCYWKHAGRVTDKKSGPKNPRSTVLNELEEKAICEFRRLTKFSLDDVFISLKDKIPALTRSNLHRCLVRHGLNKLPKQDSQKKPKKPFKTYELGYVHIDITEVRIDKQKLYLFVAIERLYKYAYVEVHERMTNKIACSFLHNLVEESPFKIHTILTDNGAQFTYALLAEHLRPKGKIHPFDQACQNHNIQHRLTKFRHPWTNGQVEIFNRKIKENTTKKYQYDTIDRLKKHLMAFILEHFLFICPHIQLP